MPPANDCYLKRDLRPRLREFAETHPRAGIVGTELRHAGGDLNPSRRRFPTVSGTSVRRTPLRRVLGDTQRAHYGLDERPTEPVTADWLLGGFLFLRREMLDELGGFDEGFRLYGEDIDLAYRAGEGGLGALVRPGGEGRPRPSGSHRQAPAHPPHALALARDRPLRQRSIRSA